MPKRKRSMASPPPAELPRSQKAPLMFRATPVVPGSRNARKTSLHALPVGMTFVSSKPQNKACFESRQRWLIVSPISGSLFAVLQKQFLDDVENPAIYYGKTRCMPWHVACEHFHRWQPNSKNKGGNYNGSEGKGDGKQSGYPT